MKRRKKSRKRKINRIEVECSENSIGPASVKGNLVFCFVEAYKYAVGEHGITFAEPGP